MSFERALNSALAYTLTTNFIPLSCIDEKEFLLFRNSSNTRSQIRLFTMKFGINSVSANGILKVYTDPQVAHPGIPIDTDNLHLKSDRKPASVNAFLKPYILERGNILNVFVIPPDLPTMFFNLNYILDPGKMALFTIQSNVAQIMAHIDLEWGESRAFTGFRRTF